MLFITRRLPARLHQQIMRLLNIILNNWLKLLKLVVIAPIRFLPPMRRGYFGKNANPNVHCKRREKTSGFKAAKDRVTFLLCSNASGDRILKPSLINRSLRPRALKGKDLKKLPVHWMANKKAWVTSATFTEWFNNCFFPKVALYLKQKILDFKVLLIVDNAPLHPNLEHPNVQIVFLPPNTTSLIQPLDQSKILCTTKLSIYFGSTWSWVSYIYRHLEKVFDFRLH